LAMKLDLLKEDDKFYWNDDPETAFDTVYDALSERGETAYIKGHYGTRTLFGSLIGNEVHLVLLSEYYRFGNDGDRLSFVDPSGGPFVSVGTPMSEYHRLFPKKAIKAIDNRTSCLVLELE